MTEARGALWTGIISLSAGIIIVLLFCWMVIDALPGPGP
jgi:hypothetical protein